MRADLSRPSAYPLPHPDRIETCETHVSYIFMTEREVYKVKKPVSLGFLDFSTVLARKCACEAEVVLNARLAAPVYLGVVPVRVGPDGRARFHSNGGANDDEIIDWAVHMLRLPDEIRADHRLVRGTLTPFHLDRLAKHLADFHARCTSSDVIASYGSPTDIARNVRDNFDAVRGTVGSAISIEHAREIEHWQLGFLDTKKDLFADRSLRGMVRDGHGDLRLDHVYFDDDAANDDDRAKGGITVLDCIEFSTRLRSGDVCADIAFFSMDLSAHGRPDLGARFVARYAREADDYDLYALVDFYEGYRATVRAKISLLLAEQRTNNEARTQAYAKARAHFALALASAHRSMLPTAVVAVGGVIASGKSTIAEALAERMSAPVVDTDRARKAILGVNATKPMHAAPFEGPYDYDVTIKTYAEAMRRAAVVLSAGRSVIIDATFRGRSERQQARALAERAGAAFVFVECRAPREVCLARLEKREREGSVSDGRRAIWDDFALAVEPIAPGEFSDGQHVTLDTTKSITENMHALVNHVGM